MNQLQKNEHYFKVAHQCAAWLSKEPSTKVGALFLSERWRSISFGYNGMPRFFNDQDPARRDVRPEKYFWFEHAERNAIYNKARDALEGALMIASEFPNMDAARAVVSSGIKTFVSTGLSLNDEKVTQGIAKRVMALFKEGGVEWINLSRTYDSPSFSQEKLQRYHALALSIGELSKDPQASLKNGCIILNATSFAPISFGYSGLANGVNDDRKERWGGHLRAYWVEDAIRNAIFNAISDVFKNARAYVSFMPCAQCTRAMINVGVKTIVAPKINLELERDQRWKESMDQSLMMLQEAGVELIFEEAVEVEDWDAIKPMPDVTEEERYYTLEEVASMLSHPLEQVKVWYENGLLASFLFMQSHPNQVRHQDLECFKTQRMK